MPMAEHAIDLSANEQHVDEPPDRPEVQPVRHAVGDSRGLLIDALKVMLVPPDLERPMLLLVHEPRFLAEHDRMRRKLGQYPGRNLGDLRCAGRRYRNHLLQKSDNFNPQQHFVYSRQQLHYRDSQQRDIGYHKR